MAIKKTVLSKLVDHITGPAVLPRVQDYTIGTWKDGTVEVKKTQIRAKSGSKYDYREEVKKYSFVQEERTGVQYLYNQAYWQKPLHQFGIVGHIFGVIAMMLVDILAACYSAIKTGYSLLTGNLSGMLTNVQQIAIRLINCAIKPLQWGGLLLCNLLGVIGGGYSFSKLYASIERDIYLEEEPVFAQLLIPVATEVQGRKNYPVHVQDNKDIIRRAQEISLYDHTGDSITTRSGVDADFVQEKSSIWTASELQKLPANQTLDNCELKTSLSSRR